MRQTWLNPQNYKQYVIADSRIAPAISPAPAGNAIVPAGYIRQIGSEGGVDTGPLFINGLPVANITQFVMPYYSGGFPPDPLAGTPGHTPQGGA